MLKYTIEQIRQSFFEDGYKLLSDSYKDSKTKLTSVCPNGHIYKTSFDKWLRGRRCLCSRGKNRISLDYIKNEFEKKGYLVLSEDYKNGDKINYICPNGHRHSIRFDHFVLGHGCPYCAGRPVITTELVKKEFDLEGYKLLSVYVNSSSNLNYICPNGHKHYINWRNWKTGYRCPECAPNMKKDLFHIREALRNEGYDILDDEYVNNKEKLHLICPNGHDYFVSWDNFSNSGSRCTKCKDWGTSVQENVLIDFIKCLKISFVERDRTIIPPYELDIVIPDKRIAIEYCGLYWHSELAGKDKKYHLNKLNLCNNAGYRLITIFEDELINSKELVFSKLMSILGLNKSNKVYARKCVIKEIDAYTASNFCNSNHIQGYGSGAKIRLGLFFEDALVSVMTFSNPSIAKGRRCKEFVWELHRFCSLVNYNVVGAASKLLSYFKKNYQWSEIFSYADRRWSVGNVYNKIGFVFEGNTMPNYWYIRKQQRLHRYGLRKMSSDLKTITEWELRKSQGWNRIWDCGNMRYSIVNNKLTL